MRWLSLLLDRLVVAAACVSAAAIGAAAVVIMVDVTMRASGLQPPIWGAAAIEYGLLYVTMLAAPLLVREGGHVAVETAVRLLPPPAQRTCGRAMTALCVLVCLLLAAVALDSTVASFHRGDFDIRAFDMPRWLLLAPLAVGLFLCAAEFLRLLLAGRVYGGDAGGPHAGGL